MSTRQGKKCKFSMKKIVMILLDKPENTHVNVIVALYIEYSGETFTNVR